MGNIVEILFIVRSSFTMIELLFLSSVVMFIVFVLFLFAYYMWAGDSSDDFQGGQMMSSSLCELLGN